MGDGRWDRWQTRDQRPVVAELAGMEAAPPSRVAITPYLIGDDSELRVLLDCKRKRAAAREAGSTMPEAAAR
jgi:hypothetical protein